MFFLLHKREIIFHKRGIMGKVLYRTVLTHIHRGAFSPPLANCPVFIKMKEITFTFPYSWQVSARFQPISYFSSQRRCLGRRPESKEIWGCQKLMDVHPPNLRPLQLQGAPGKDSGKGDKGGEDSGKGELQELCSHT